MITRTRHAERLLVAALVVLLTAVPSARAVCGNGVREAAEDCDGSDLGPYTCGTFCGDGGTLRCASDCTFDLAGCEVCGNGRRDGNEACDGSDLAGQACPQGGTLRCRVDCAGFDVRDCFACGNAVREGGEQCDGPDVGGATCNAAGETGGNLACTSSCTLDRSGCFRCGNGRLDPGEECDDGNTVSNDGCSTTCHSDCGDGTLQGTEQCDDGNRTDGDGCSALCYVELPYGGGGNEPFDLCMAQWSALGVTAASTMTCRDGTAACDRGVTAGSCTFQFTICFNVEQYGPSFPCQPIDVVRVALVGGTTLAASEQSAFLSAVRATLGRFGSAATITGSTVDVAPRQQGASLCAAATVAVPVGGQRSLVVDTTDSTSRVDHDQLTFACTP